MFGTLPTAPWRVGHYPGAPDGLGLGSLGAEKTIAKALSELCSSTEHHTRCEGGRTVSKPCTAIRNCATHALVSTDCWNDQVCPSGGGGGGGGGGGAGAPGSMSNPTLDGIHVDACWDDPRGHANCSASGKKKVADAYCGVLGQGAATHYGERKQGGGTEYLPTHRKCGGCSATLVDLTCEGALPPPPPPLPLPSVPAPPWPGSAPPTPVQVCNAPSNVTLGYAERWVEVDPIQCLWQIIRTTTAGQPQVLPQVYGGTPVIEIPQSAEPGEIPLSPGAVGLYQPSWQLPGGGFGGGSGELSATAILQAAVDVLGRGLTPEEMTEVTGKHFTNIAELYTYLREELGTGIVDGGGVIGDGIGLGWFSEHPYLALGGAAVGLWFLFGGRRR